MAELVLTLPELPSTELDAKVHQELVLLYNAIRKLQSSLNYDVGLVGEPTEYWPQLQAVDGVSEARSRLYLKCSEPISYGQAVNVWLNGSELQARLARADDVARLCSCFCHTPGSHAVGDIAEFFLPPCLIESVGGMSPGSYYWLSTVPGEIINVPITAPGIVQQLLGQALSPTALWFTPSFGGAASTTIIVRDERVTGTVTVTVPPASMAHTETVSAPGVVPTMTVFGQPAQHSGGGSTFAIQSAVYTAGTDQITIDLVFSVASSGPINFNFTAV